MARFSDWLTLYDSWLSRPVLQMSPDEKQRIELEIVMSIVDNPLFRAADSETKATLIKLTFLAYRPKEESEYRVFLEKALYHFLMKRIFLQAVHGLTNRVGTSATIKVKQLSLSETQSVDTLEFRRIPAHANALEAARWMRLLEGHWQLAYNDAGLVPLVRPRAPRTKSEKLSLFYEYICAGGMNPMDFTRHLTSRMALLAQNFNCSQPRWSQTCRELLSK